MIVPMQKVTLFVSAKAQEPAIQQLRRLGVLHIHHIQPPTSESVNTIEKQLAQTEKALGILKTFRPTPPASPSDTANALEIVSQSLNLFERRNQLNAQLEVEREKQAWFDRWGNITRADLHALQERGLYVRLYAADRSFLKKLSPDYLVFFVGQERSRLYLALVTDNPEQRLELKEEALPAESRDLVDEQIAQLTKEILTIDQALQDLSQYNTALETYRTSLRKQLEFARVQAGMAQAEQICYLTGFCPTERLNALQELANQEGWGYLCTEPDNPAEVPTLLRRPKWLEMVAPIFKFMGTVPGYNEYDISFVFLCFFSVFFAILIGDAGYGLVFLLAAILLRRKFRHAPQEPFILLYVLSSALIVWGAITGNWFGFESLARLPILNNLIIEKMNTWSHNSDQVTQFLMYFTFLIGALHLTIGHAINGAKKFPHLSFLSQLGWIFVVWCMFFLANTLVLAKPLPAFVVNLLIAGAVLIACFDNYSKGKFLRGIGATIGNLPLNIIGSFGDVVSYLRLFAVGLAGAVVEQSFNSMALGGGLGNLVKILMAILVLLFGHVLNMALCAMSVIVHGIRLNMLEFSNHLGMTWSGHEYQPFKE